MLDTLIVILLVGLVAGFLASHLVAGHGYGLIGDIAAGVVGAILGTWLLGLIGVVVSGLLAEIFVAFIGAVIVIALLRAVTHPGFRSRYSGYRRRRFF
jgi:uncharacterized membrane protein YeaQ/YmgE (transglycosylase-associated protein family)